MWMILSSIFLFFLQFAASFNDFPSLMIANASMAVLIERSFYTRKILAKETSVFNEIVYKESLAVFGSEIVRTVQNHMNTSGLSIRIFHTVEVDLSKDYTVLLSIATCSVTWNLFEKAQKEKLVHFGITDPDCPRLPVRAALSIPLVDPGEELPQIFYDLKMTKKLTWTRVNIIHDDEIDSDVIKNVIDAFFSELDQPESTIHLATTSLLSFKRAKSEFLTKRRIKQILDNLPARTPIDDHFLVIVGFKTLPILIETARSLRLLHPQSQWLFVVPDMAEHAHGDVSFLIDYLDEGENVAFLYNDTIDPKSNSSCHLGATCHIKELTTALASALEQALAEEIELYHHLTEEEYEASGITKLVRSRHLMTYIRNELYNTTRADRPAGSVCGRCIRWIVASALTWGNKIGTESQIRSHQLRNTAVWTPDPGFQSKDVIFPHAAYGFMGKSLPIATYHNPPWQIEMTKTQSDAKEADSMTSEWDGLIFDVVEELAKRLNFSYKLVVVEAPPEIIIAKADPLRASMSASEKVPEAVTELVRSKSVFLAACAYTIATHGRDASINLTQPISVQTYGLLAPKPRPLSRALLFASPFSNEAWACLASAILLVGPVLYAVHTLSSRTMDIEVKDSGSVVLLGLDSPSRCIWYIYGALLQQGGMNLPKNDGARLIVGTWWLVVMVIVATYSGSLVAFLTFPKMEVPVKTVDDLLARKTEFTWSIPAGSFLEDYLLVSSAKGTIDYRNLLQEHEPHAEKHGTTTYLQNVQKVKRGKHALIDWVTSLMISTQNEYISSGTCHFSLGTDVLILGEPISMIVPAGSPYLTLINVQLQRMQEAGLLNKWTADRIPVKDQCSEGSLIGRETDNHKVSLEDMQGIFFVLLLGYFIGTVALGWEFIKQRLKIAKEAKLIRPFID